MQHNDTNHEISTCSPIVPSKPGSMLRKTPDIRGKELGKML